MRTELRCGGGAVTFATIKMDGRGSDARSKVRPIACPQGRQLAELHKRPVELIHSWRTRVLGGGGGGSSATGCQWILPAAAG